MTTTYSFIAACDLDGGIGKNRNMAWYIKKDMKRFREITCVNNKTNIVIMGRYTWESIGCIPLAKRINMVVSQTISPRYDDDIKTYFVPSFENALSLSFAMTNHNIFVIGGEKIYLEALSDPRCVNGHLTIVNHIFDCDTFFPIDLMDNYETIHDGKWEYDDNSNVEYRFIDVVRR
jgi:dihydrofolate reductase